MERMDCFEWAVSFHSSGLWVFKIIEKQGKNMKKILFALVAVMFILPINLFAKDNKQGSVEEFQYRYISKAQVEDAEGKILRGRLKFLLVSDDNDYEFTVFERYNGETISMNGTLDPSLGLKKGDPVFVEWKLTTLREAAEGNAPYYFWKIIKVVNLKKKP